MEPRDRIRILHVQAVDAIGGTERTNFTVLTGMDRSRYANEICVLGPEGPYREQYAAAGIPAHYLYGNPARFARLLLRNKYDLIFLYGLRANLLGRLIAPWLSAAVRVEVKHGIDRGRSRMARALDRWTRGLVHYFVSNSHAGARVLSECEGKPADRVTVIHNGIDPTLFQRPANGVKPQPQEENASLRIVSVANLLPCKGHRYLVEAIALLHAQGLPCTLSIAGDGPERRKLEALAARCAPGRVQLLGHHSNIAELLSAADIFVQPSLSEGLPNSVMEAMAAGLPVVATEVGGNGELVLDGVTGLLVPAGSSDALTTAVSSLAGREEVRARMGRAGRDRVESRFPMAKMIAGFEQFCEARATRERPDVLFITTTGMAVRYLIRDKIAALTAAGYRVRVLCGEDEYAGELRAEGLALDTVAMSRFVRPGADLRTLASLVHYLQRVRPRIVHTCTPKAGLLGPLAARIAGVPALHSVFGLLFHDRGSRRQNLVYGAAERLTATCASHLLFQSLEDLECVRSLGWKADEHLCYVGNGSDLDRFNPDSFRGRRDSIRAALGYSRHDFVVGIVARLLRTKGLEELLASAEQLRDVRHVKFLVIGPRERNHPGAIDEALITAATAGGSVQFLGERRDMPAMYAAMDAFALPSYREGVPRSLMEASAMALPVIASDIRGCREVVEPGRTGWLVPVRDASAVARAIRECSANPRRARAMGLAGRERMRLHFDQQLVHTRLLRLYEKLLGPRARCA